MQIVRRAVELALPLVAEVGHTFTHDWLAKALELPEPTTIAEYKKSEMRRMALVITWCDVLLAEHGIHIENSRSKGYTVIDPKLTTQVVTASVKRESDKIFSQAFDKLTLTNAEGLTRADVAARHDAMAWVGAMNMMLKKQRPRPPKRPELKAIDAAPPEGE